MENSPSTPPEVNRSQRLTIENPNSTISLLISNKEALITKTIKETQPHHQERKTREIQAYIFLSGLELPKESLFDFPKIKGGQKELVTQFIPASQLVETVDQSNNPNLEKILAAQQSYLYFLDSIRQPKYRDQFHQQAEDSTSCPKDLYNHFKKYFGRFFTQTENSTLTSAIKTMLIQTASQVLDDYEANVLNYQYPTEETVFFHNDFHFNRNSLINPRNTPPYIYPIDFKRSGWSAKFDTLAHMVTNPIFPDILTDTSKNKFIADFASHLEIDQTQKQLLNLTLELTHLKLIAVQLCGLLPKNIDRYLTHQETPAQKRFRILTSLHDTLQTKPISKLKLT